MLEKIDLEKRCSKEEYKSKIDKYDLKLGELQRIIVEKKIPVIIIFEGWGASGKGTFINDLIIPLDPRHFKVFSSFSSKSDEEYYRPHIWKYWIKTPPRGSMAIFDKGWYRHIMEIKGHDEFLEEQYKRMIEDTISFEETLLNDNYVIIKLFLHISKSEQKERFKKILNSHDTSWRLKKADFYQNENYDKCFKAIDKIIKDTNTEKAPWITIAAENSRIGEIQVKEECIKQIEKAIKKSENKDILKNDIKLIKSRDILSEYEANKDISHEEYKKELKILQDELQNLSYRCYRERIPVIIAYEGWDAGGKGGNIKRLTEKMDPRGYEVIPIAAPTDEELAHNHLWRFWTKIPKAGHFTIFDRTWYGRVLVERIEGYCSKNDWIRAYDEINQMEKQFTNFGIEVFKFWLQIDKDEQFARFKDREETPEKRWKITEDDWRNREKWDEYWEAVNDMIAKTSTEKAPWEIIESNNKQFARIKVLKIVTERLKKRLGK